VSASKEIDCEDVPVFSCGRSSRNRAYIVFVCPKCGARNCHGGGERLGDGDGHRVSHCGCWPNGYDLKERATDGTGIG
jgi:predicted RNA-binding Zn-ribbon protein involved in translation (DUF1610 family)